MKTEKEKKKKKHAIYEIKATFYVFVLKLRIFIAASQLRGLDLCGGCWVLREGVILISFLFLSFGVDGTSSTVG